MDTEYSVKLRMEKFSKSKNFLTLCGFFSLFSVCVLVALLFTPGIIIKHSVDIYKCEKHEHEYCYSNKTIHEV